MITLAPRPERQHLDHHARGEQEGEEDAGHDQRGAADDAGGLAEAGGDAVHVVVLGEPVLADARQQEHLVVHRQAENDGEDDHRHVGLDGDGAADAEQARAPAPLEDGDDDPVGGADRQEVEQRRLEREHQAAERRQQQQERRQEDDADDDRQPRGDGVLEVDRRRRGAGDVAGGVLAVQRAGQDVVLELADQRRGVVALGPALGDHLADQQLAVRAGLERASPRRRRGGRSASWAATARATSAPGRWPTRAAATTTVSGPLAPGAEAVADRVKGLALAVARRLRSRADVADADREDRDGEDEQHEDAAERVAPRMALEPARCSGAAGRRDCWARPPACGRASRSIWVPASASSAGTSVSAARAATVTVIAAASPSLPMKVIPDAYSPHMAMTTVVAAITIDRPLPAMRGPDRRDRRRRRPSGAGDGAW